MVRQSSNARLRLYDARDDAAALLLIDLQKAVDDVDHNGIHSNPVLDDRVDELLRCWRGGNGHIVHVRHFSHTPGSLYRSGHAGAEFKASAMPLAGERIVTKHVESPFIGTDLDIWLRRHGISRLVVAGVSTGHAVSTAARHAHCLDFGVVVVADACASFAIDDLDGQPLAAEDVQRFSLALLGSHYARISSTQEVVQQF
ncbi:Nicotinamidase-related amidase [Onishia taeanensis]|jgi:nicotinamidase-related amidase|uniref:Nicotinamidase-related amidase n=1 Tax=Onishia taeanensis TaxID=284577 RepID=A0A1G7NIE0_9GAMM|nr:isochorismatase family protein [Halomonas taeanensis]SDF73834.1 Nicotinamidase-related amidase [Halomonas taeanensis]